MCILCTLKKVNIFNSRIKERLTEYLSEKGHVTCKETKLSGWLKIFLQKILMLETLKQHLQNSKGFIV